VFIVYSYRRGRPRDLIRGCIAPVPRCSPGGQRGTFIVAPRCRRASSRRVGPPSAVRRGV